MTFCLLGVATPSELIRDVRITPFNIGRRIELTDFTLAELAPYEAPLSAGGRNGAALLRRIHHWTHGHPYLTQKLAAAVAADVGVKTPGGVDRLVETLFFALKARTDEPNLSDVARRVLESPIEGVSPEEARARILDTYRQIRESRVRDDDTDPVVSVLKLSGLTRVLEGYLVVRNRIYFRAFDRSWVEANLPEAEILRQRKAARRAAMRVGLLAGSVAVAIGALAVFGFVKANSEAVAKAEAKRATGLAEARARSEAKAKEDATRRANEAEEAKKEAEEANKQTLAALETAKSEKERADEKAEEARKANEQTKSALAQATREEQAADRERRKAVDEKNRADALAKQERDAREATDRLLYQANMNLIQTAFENNQFGRVQELLDESAKPIYAAFRGPEWGYWDYRMNTYLVALKGHTGSVKSASFSPDGTRVVTASEDGTARVWTARDGSELVALKGHTGSVNSASFSPDGARVVTASEDNTARVWDARDGRELAALKGHGSLVASASFSPDGTRVVTASEDRTARVWDARDGRELAALKGHTSAVYRASFSPDGTRVVTASEDGTARVWDARDGRELVALKGHESVVWSSSFSPDGTRVVTASFDSTARVWDARDGRELAALKGHRGSVMSASFSPDGTRVVTASDDNTARVWDARDGRELAALKGHTESVRSASFSPDGRYLLIATGNWARIVPLSRGAAAELTFVRPEAWVAEQLTASAKAGDAFAWNWQTQHWLTPELVGTEEMQGAFEAALDSPDPGIVTEARKRLTRLPPSYLRSTVPTLAREGRWSDLSDLATQIVGDPRATATDRKVLALVRLRLGDREGWRGSARAAVEALKPDSPADDVFQAAIAARAAPGALDDYGPLLEAVEKAAASDPQRYARAASPGAMLFRAGWYEEAEKRLRPAVQGDNPSRFGHVFLAMTLAKLGHFDEARALLAQVEAWADAKPAQGNAPTNLAAQTWDFRLELELLLAEAREMLGLPKPDTLLGYAERALAFHPPRTSGRGIGTPRQALL